jgi:ribosome recycling factor
MRKGVEDDVQKLVDQAIASIDAKVAAKEDDIMKV